MNTATRPIHHSSLRMSSTGVCWQLFLMSTFWPQRPMRRRSSPDTGLGSNIRDSACSSRKCVTRPASVRTAKSVWMILAYVHCATEPVLSASLPKPGNGWDSPRSSPSPTFFNLHPRLMIEEFFVLDASCLTCPNRKNLDAPGGGHDDSNR